MKPITKLYLKTFLFTGFPYSLMMLLFDQMEGKDFSLGKFLFLAFFFGTFMSLVFVSIQKKKLKKMGVQEFTDEILSVNQMRSLRTGLNVAELLSKLKNDPIYGNMKIEEMEKRIELKTGLSWKSWGEKISIQLKQQNGNDFDYQLSSSPVFILTLIDYGKNLENLNRLEQTIKDFA